MEAMIAPTDPFAGWANEGDGGFGRPCTAGLGIAGAGLGGGLAVPLKVMVGSSAIIANSKPAQPSCLSTAVES
jgi:hypothetical protein